MALCFGATLHLVRHDDILPGDERLSAILRAATVFAFPSEIDLSPNAVLEAMAMGVPVVATAVGGPVEIVRHGVDGLLLPPRHPEQWTRAVRALMRDPQRLAEMGGNGRAQALARFGVAPKFPLPPELMCADRPKPRVPARSHSKIVPSRLPE